MALILVRSWPLCYFLSITEGYLDIYVPEESSCIFHYGMFRKLLFSLIFSLTFSGGAPLEESKLFLFTVHKGSVTSGIRDTDLYDFQIYNNGEGTRLSYKIGSIVNTLKKSTDTQHHDLQVQYTNLET